MNHLLVRDVPRLARLPAARLLSSRSTQYIRQQNYRSSLPRCFHSSQRRPVVIPYLLADIGEGITECQVISWSVKPGDRVEQFDSLCEVQSDKASVEITSRFDGTITALHYDTDDMAIVGKPLVDIDVDDDVTVADNLLVPQADLEKQAGKIEEAEELVKEDMQRVGGRQDPEEIPEIGRDLNQIFSSSFSATKVSGKQTGLVTPGVRHMLKKYNLDVAKIKGTGRYGRVLKEDVQQPILAVASTSISTNISVSARGDRVVPLTPTENQMFKVMTQSLNIPHFLYTHGVDFASLNNSRKRFNTNATVSSIALTSGDSAPKLTPLPFIMKALSLAFVQYPKLNAHLDVESIPNKPQLLIKSSHNFGIAVDTPQGLLVPDVKDVQNHSIMSLATEINRLSILARNGKLGVDDFKGATFTVSNIGSIGGSTVGPVIVSPNVGILGVGRARDIPAFQKDEQGIDKIVKREEVTLSWSADHRIIDGATLARCAKIVQEVLENVELIGAILK